MATLTTEQRRALDILRGCGCYMIADQAERQWQNGQASYVDDRVIRAHRELNRAFVKLFVMGNQQATGRA